MSMDKFCYAGAALAVLLATAGCAEDAEDSDQPAQEDAEVSDTGLGMEEDAAGQDQTAGGTQATQPGQTGEGGTRTPQTALTIDVAQSDEFGEYLTDGQGRPLYMFTADKQGGAGSEPQIECTGQCLDAWPLAATAGAPRAQGGANPSLVGQTRHEGETVVTYAGWPLYYFARDDAAGAPKGNEIESFGGEWYLVTPEGMKAGKAGEGAAQPETEEEGGN